MASKAPAKTTSKKTLTKKDVTMPNTYQDFNGEIPVKFGAGRQPSEETLRMREALTDSYHRKVKKLITVTGDIDRYVRNLRQTANKMDMGVSVGTTGQDVIFLARDKA